MSPERDLISWGGQPSHEREYHRIVRARPGSALRALVLSDHAELVLVHWVGQRSRPHLIPPGSCPGCQARTRYRLVGYLAGWLPASSTWSIVEVPEEASTIHYDALRGLGGSLRGLRVVLVRAGQAANSRVDLSWEGSPHSVGELPPVPDLRAALVRIWFHEKGDGNGEAVGK